ncbi:MAG: S8 family serine peptidase [Bacteroidetes bacterium]|nr:S8 family serine peptidase [Bacteroidota bacterium]
MKKKLLSFIFALFACIAWSQSNNEKDFSISLNGNRITTTANFKQQFDVLKKEASKQSKSKEYTLLQFTKMPSLEEQNELKNQGITLISYLSNNAYYVAIDSKYYNQSTASKNIRAIVPIDAKFKIDPNITSGTIPEYAMDFHSVKVTVSYFKGVDKDLVSKDLTSLGVKTFKILESFNQVYLQVAPENVIKIAKLNWVQNIELIGPPVESDNQPGVSSHKANVLNSLIPGLGYNLTGKGVKVGIWDGNLEKHIDHTGRVINREYESPSSHGEHVSGTVGGAGILDPRAKGMAPNVQMYGWNFNTQSNGLPVYVERELAFLNDDVDLTSNSYGVLLSAGYNIVRYSTSDRGDDDVTAKYPSLLNIYSNGNAQAAAAGGFYTSTKASKNALHVAANNPDDLISSYSSFGPTLDGRLVPQISAVGSSVYSLDYNNSYQVMSGTSMATPGTSGTVALLYERYKNIYGEKPLASLMKALVSNTAKDVGNPGPDYKYGFGNLNGLRAVKVLDNKMFYTASVANGVSFEKEIVVPAGLVSLKVMLAYSDIGATPGSSNIQVNDLDVKIIRNGTTTLPWILNPSVPSANATRGVDNLNNIEQITLDSPAAGTYKIIVTGTSVPLNSQEFAVVYDYVAPELVLTYPIGGEKFSPDATEYIRWDYEGVEKTFNIEFSNDGGNSYTVIAANVPAAARNFAWKVPNEIVPNAKIRISAGSRVETSKETFAIMSEPKNLVITPASCGVAAYKMDWTPITGAKYEVLRLNGFEFDIVATVTDPTYTFTDLTVGNNNWFTVRAVDIASGIVSERARAINVEPISKPVLTALNLPFKEDFNDRKPVNYTLSKASAAGSIGFESQSLARLDAVKMSGSSVAGSPLWATSTATTAFTTNSQFIKRLTFCEIDASSLAGSAMRMKFDVIMQNSVTTNKNFFRVLVNGVVQTSTEGLSVYSGTTTSTARTLTYNLAAFAGTKFNLSFEGVMDNDATSTPVYNTIFVDNVELFEVKTNDLALTAFTANVGVTATEQVSAKIYNFSPVAVSNIPISYQINNQTEVTEIVPGPIAPLSELTYNFTQRANYSVGGLYTVVGKVSLADDSNLSNNSLTRTVANNGTDVLMVSGSTKVTCSDVFTDSGSRYGNYANNLVQTMTFRPAVTGNSIKVDFTEFAVEAGYDFLYIYNGTSTSAPLLGVFDGNTLPPSFTSTATGGELFFRFTSDTEVTDKGWVANITCVAKPVVSADTEITSILSPDFIGKKTATTAISIRVNNAGPVTRTNVPVYYQVNGGTKITGIVPSMAPSTAVTYTFPTTTDMSAVNGVFTIKAGIDEVDDIITNNDLEKVVYNKFELPNNTNTSGYAITSFKWDTMVNNSGISGYSDFKNIKIPVYAGYSYQPQVTINKPERAIGRDVTTTPGVFTMILIDLNGDGDLTDEFAAGTYWVNTISTSVSPAIVPTPSTHYFRQRNTLTGPLTIPAGTVAGEKLMRVYHMFRSPSEFFNVILGPTFDGITTSREDFEVEEYTINVLPFTAADASIESITAPTKLGMKPVTVSAVIRNFSNVAISNFPVAYKVNGGAEVVQTYTASLAAGASAAITFATKADLSAVGNYTLEVYTKLAGDLDTTNDSKAISFTHVPNATTNVVGTFDGLDDYVRIDASTALDLRNNYTFEAWVNRNNPTVFGRIIDKSIVNLFVHTNNNSTYKENSLVLSITTATGSYILNTGLNSVLLNKWHHIAFTVSAANIYTIYIDGIVAPYTFTGTAGMANTNATSPAYIGGNPTATRGLDGSIDEVRIWSGVKTQAELVANATTKYVGTEAGLLAYYSFAEGDKQFVFDTTANDNTAVVINADTNGLGAGKFWNTAVLLQSFELKDQLSSSYDDATKTYTVLLKDGINVATAVPVFTAGMNAVATVNGNVQVSGLTANNFTNPVTFTVSGVGFNLGLVETYTIKVITGLSDKSSLLAYDFKVASNPGLTQEVNTVIVGANASATAPFGVNTSKLKASFTVSPGAELFIDDVKQTSGANEFDYTNNVLVTVVSENKLSKTNYIVSVNARNTEAKLLSYTVSNQIGAASIDEAQGAVKVMVNNNANLSALVPVFQVSQNAVTRIGTYLQNSGVTTLNYSGPVSYNVMSESGLFKNYTVVVERVKPVITLLGSAVTSVAQGCTFTEAGFTATDNLNNTITLAVVKSGTVNTNVIGQYTLTYTVKDALNNESFVTRTVNVVANQKPVIIASANIIVNSATNSCGATVAIVAATATDDCAVGSPVGLRSDGLALNATYPLGVTTIKWNVVDNSGSAAIEVLQTVTVQDKTAPIVITKNITIQLDASANAIILPAAVNNGSTDNCSIALIELDKTTFNCSNVGVNTVTLKVTDASGNVGTATATVTVENSRPNLIRKHFDNVIFFDNSSNSFKAYSWYKNGVLVPSQTNQYFTENGTLNGTYYAVGTKTDGSLVVSCPLIFSSSIEQEFIKIAPNPVRTNSTYQLTTNIATAALQNARITVISMLGTVLTDKVTSTNTVDLVSPSVEGIYIVKMTLSNGKYYTKNLLVKN